MPHLIRGAIKARESGPEAGWILARTSLKTWTRLSFGLRLQADLNGAVT
jgi:hypothetical protein